MSRSARYPQLSSESASLSLSVKAVVHRGCGFVEHALVVSVESVNILTSAEIEQGSQRHSVSSRRFLRQFIPQPPHFVATLHLKRRRQAHLLICSLFAQQRSANASPVALHFPPLG